MLTVLTQNTPFVRREFDVTPDNQPRRRASGFARRFARRVPDDYFLMYEALIRTLVCPT
jgi:hypothetical protein